MSDQPMKTSGFGIGEAGKTPASSPQDEADAMRSQPIRVKKMVTCDCGHTVPEILVMSASRGTCCPDCYDEMSD